MDMCLCNVLCMYGYGTKHMLNHMGRRQRTRDTSQTQRCTHTSTDASHAYSAESVVSAGVDGGRRTCTGHTFDCIMWRTAGSTHNAGADPPHPLRGHMLHRHAHGPLLAWQRRALAGTYGSGDDVTSDGCRASAVVATCVSPAGRTRRCEQ